MTKMTYYLIRKNKIDAGGADPTAIYRREYLFYRSGKFGIEWIEKEESESLPSNMELVIFSTEEKANLWLKINSCSDNKYTTYEVLPFEIKLDFKVPKPKKEEEPKITEADGILNPMIHAAVPAFP